MKTLALALACVAMGLLAQQPNAKALIGSYKGKVEGDFALFTLNADGTASVKPPEAEEGFRIRGKWKLAKPGVVLEIAAPDNPNEKVIVRFRIDKEELVLIDVKESDGELKTYEPPRFRQTKAGAKNFTGEYRGRHKNEDLRVVVKAGGQVEIWPDDADAIRPRFKGRWNAEGAEVICMLQTNDGPAEVILKQDGKDFLLVQLETRNEQLRYGFARFKKTKPAVAKPLPAAIKKLVGIYQGTVEESTARMILRADRTATAQPDINRPNRKLTGKWKVAKDTIEVALTNQENETGTVILEIVGANLRLAKVISPDGEVEEHDAILKRQK